MRTFYGRNRRKPITATNAIFPAFSRSKDWGFGPISGNGGKTTNFAPIAPKGEKKEEK